MSKIAYIRVSSETQKTDRQDDLLKAENPKKVFRDVASGRNTNRPEFQKMMEYVREGDVVIVESISRLSRSTRDFLNTMDVLSKKGVQVISLKEKIDTSTHQGRFLLTVLAGLSELERETTLERQREGIESAKARDVKFGRPKVEEPENWKRVKADKLAGRITTKEALALTGLKRGTFYNLLKSA